MEDIVLHEQQRVDRLHEIVMNKAKELTQQYVEYRAMGQRGRDSALLRQFLGDFANIPAETCLWMHQSGLNTDDDGDVEMEEACSCESANTFIPDCFLLSYFYMVTASNVRNNRFRISKDYKLEENW